MCSKYIIDDVSILMTLMTPKSASPVLAYDGFGILACSHRRVYSDSDSDSLTFRLARCIRIAIAVFSTLLTFRV